MPSGPLATGAEIDGFVLGERIHAGAMGRLFRVAHPDHLGPMVMKLPRFGAGESAESLLGFETESTILSALSGSHFPRLIAVGDLERVPYLVLPFIGGEGLGKIAARAPLPAEEIARLGAAIADALHVLHRQDAIHLDLKPDNVIVRPDGLATLIDFGLAHHARFPDLLAEEQRHMAGSAPYVSPEQVEGRRDDPRSDLFALGVVLYELASGELPFGIPATTAGLRDRLWRDPLPPRAHVASVPPWLQEVILRCLEVKAAARYQSAAHVAFDLRHPDRVQLTGRAGKSAAASPLAQLRRWWGARHGSAASRGRRAEENRDAAPVILVAVDTGHPDTVRDEALLRATRRRIAVAEEFRLVCLAVRGGFERPVIAAAESTPDPDGHLDHLVRLRHWVEPLKLPPERLSLHVVEALRPAGAILDFARRNHADTIILGAPTAGERALAWWRSAASAVASQAPCSVHLVRAPAAHEAPDNAFEIPAFTEEDVP